MALPKFDEWRRENGLLPTEGIAWDHKVKTTGNVVTTKEKCDLLLKLNSATKDDLCEVKGIGEKTAEKIIEQGPYENFDEVTEKAKLKEGVSKALKGWLEVA